jgi:hypothetical protein
MHHGQSDWRLLVAKKMSLKYRYGVFALIVFAACNPVRGCPEASYELASESRLPKWFVEKDASRDRGDLKVKMTFYVPPIRIDNVELELLDKAGKRIASVMGRSQSHPVSLKPENRYRGRPRFPRWDIVTVNGTFEVVEFKRMEPRFYVSDDPALIQSAKEFIEQSPAGTAR